MAWHSSTHSLYGVACTDCHNPHPHTGVQADREHQPHRRSRGQNECRCRSMSRRSVTSAMPTSTRKTPCRRTIRSRKARWSAPIATTLTDRPRTTCKEPTVNLVCYQCHAEKQGPFAYEHPPVTENCGICHNPHGTVANNLLHQPATFLCLRCHTGHRTGPIGSESRTVVGRRRHRPQTATCFLHRLHAVP